MLTKTLSKCVYNNTNVIFICYIVPWTLTHTSQQHFSLSLPFLKAMGSRNLFGVNYLLLKPEEATVFDLGTLLFSSKLSNRRFIECPEGVEAEYFRQRWLIFTSVVAQILLLASRNSLKRFGDMLEFWINLLSWNGGFKGLFFNILRGNS